MTPAQRAARLYQQRRDRDEAFGVDRDGFGEPAWDMLLWIFAQGDGARPSVEATIGAAEVPDDIARPYVMWLESRSMIRIDTSRLTLTGRATALMLTVIGREKICG